MKAKYFKKLRAKAKYYYIIHRNSKNAEWKDYTNKDNYTKVLSLSPYDTIERYIRRKSLLFINSNNNERLIIHPYELNYSEKEKAIFIIIPSIRPSLSNATYWTLI